MRICASHSLTCCFTVLWVTPYRCNWKRFTLWLSSDKIKHCKMAVLFFYLEIRAGHVTIYLTARNLLQAPLQPHTVWLIKSELHKSNRPIETPQPLFPSCVVHYKTTHVHTPLCTYVWDDHKIIFSSNGNCSEWHFGCCHSALVIWLLCMCCLWLGSGSSVFLQVWFKSGRLSWLNDQTLWALTLIRR